MSNGQAVAGMPWTQIAGSAYRAYAASTSHKNFRGEPMPAFEELPNSIQVAWEAAVRHTGACLQLQDTSFLPEMEQHWDGWLPPQYGGPKEDTPVSTISRRCDVERLTPAEKAIREAMLAIEKAGAHPLLTDAVVLLAQAFHKAADYVDRDAVADSFAAYQGWSVQEDKTAYTQPSFHIFAPQGTYFGTMGSAERAWEIANSVACHRAAQELIQHGDRR